MCPELLTNLAAAGAYSSTMKIKQAMDSYLGVSLQLYMCASRPEFPLVEHQRIISSFYAYELQEIHQAI
jgi:hypothetical protein